MRFLNSGQAAEEFGLSKSWLARLRLEGNGPTYCKVGKRILYNRDSFQTWLQSHEQRSTSENT
jgi:hypothetical protein